MPFARRGLLSRADSPRDSGGFRAVLSDGVSFSPDDIAGLELWLDAQDASTITLDTGKVSQWDDKSSLDNHVVQATAGNRPVESTVDGKNGINFVDATDLLSLASASITGLDGADITIFAVYSKDFDEAGDGWSGLVGRVTPSSWINGWKLGATTSAATDLAMHVNSYTTNKASTTDDIASGADAWKCAQGVFKSLVPRMEIFIDGDFKATKNAGVMTTTGLNLAVGSADTNANLGWVGDIGEVIIYNSVLSAEDVASVEAYLAGRWGITFAAAPAPDPDFDSVVLLLDFLGPNAGTNITDLSNSAHDETFFSAAQLEIANTFLGENSLLLDGAVDQVTYADHADWDFDTDDFTVELGINTDATGASQTCIATYDGSIGWWIQYFTGTPAKLRFGWGASVLYEEDWTPFSADTWYHVAVSRSGTNLRVFVDGVQLGATVTDSTDMTASTGALTLGSLDGAQDWDGNLGAVRITKGVARYTANFTALTEFYPVT